jgi:hypothetical protein
MNDLIRLRDEFAMAALQSIGTWMPVGFGNLKADESLKARAEWAYRQADHMMDAREKDQPDHSPGLNVDTERAALSAYERMTDNDPIVHSNRFPSWSELTEEQRQEWRNKVME